MNVCIQFYEVLGCTELCCQILRLTLLNIGKVLQEVRSEDIPDHLKKKFQEEK